MINMRSSHAVNDNDSSQGFHTQGCLGRHSLPNLLSGLLILTPNLTPTAMFSSLSLLPIFP